jgi:hypothetical protein
MSPVSIDISCPSFIAAPRICDRRSAIRSMLPGVRISGRAAGRSPRQARARAHRHVARQTGGQPAHRAEPRQAGRRNAAGTWGIGVSVIAVPSLGGRCPAFRKGSPTGLGTSRGTRSQCSRQRGLSGSLARPCGHHVAPMDREGSAPGILRAVERGIGIGHQPVGIGPVGVGRGHGDADGGRNGGRPHLRRNRPFDPADQACRQGGDRLFRDGVPEQRSETRPRRRAPPCPAGAGPAQDFDTSLNTWSPAAWPCVSFTCLKKSRSRCRSANSAFGSSSRRLSSVHRAPVGKMPSADRSTPACSAASRAADSRSVSWRDSAR